MATRVLVDVLRARRRSLALFPVSLKVSTSRDEGHQEKSKWRKVSFWTAWQDRPWREYSSEGTTKRAFGRISWYRSLDLQVDRRRPCYNGKAADPQIFVDPFDHEFLRFSFWNTIALRLSFSEEWYTIPITHLVVVERNATLQYLLRYRIESQFNFLRSSAIFSSGVKSISREESSFLKRDNKISYGSRMILTFARRSCKM